MRRPGFTLFEAIVVLFLILVLAVILFPMFARVRENKRRATCQNNLKQVTLALRQYINADLTFPHAGDGRAAIANTPFGWADALQPYLKSTEPLQCPSEPTSANPDPTRGGYTDYWYNANCAVQRIDSFTDVNNTVTHGDGRISGGDARYSTTHEVNTTEENSRHLGGNNFAFSPGHVKWLKPGQVSATNSPKASYSFKIK